MIIECELRKRYALCGDGMVAARKCETGIAEPESIKMYEILHNAMPFPGSFRRVAAFIISHLVLPPCRRNGFNITERVASTY